MPMKNPPHPGDFIRTEIIRKPGGKTGQRPLTVWRNLWLIGESSRSP
jgi:hypothetical protein